MRPGLTRRRFLEAAAGLSGVFGVLPGAALARDTRSPQALALSAALHEIPATILMPEDAPAGKLAATRSHHTRPDRLSCGLCWNRHPNRNARSFAQQSSTGAADSRALCIGETQPNRSSGKYLLARTNSARIRATRDARRKPETKPGGAPAKAAGTPRAKSRRGASLTHSDGFGSSGWYDADCIPGSAEIG